MFKTIGCGCPLSTWCNKGRRQSAAAKNISWASHRHLSSLHGVRPVLPRSSTGLNHWPGTEVGTGALHCLTRAFGFQRAVFKMQDVQTCLDEHRLCLTRTLASKHSLLFGPMLRLHSVHRSELAILSNSFDAFFKAFFFKAFSSPRSLGCQGCCCSFFLTLSKAARRSL